MRINYNVSAMISNNALTNNDNLLTKSLQRLSSGYKLNNAKDNPAGLAMAKRMNAQIEGISVAGQNASDGVSIIETADGALSEVSDMLQRMNELAVKASNGTMTQEDREIIQSEIAQLKSEITRVADTTEFNGQKLLNGEFARKGYTDVQEIKVNSYSAEVRVDDYEVNGISLSRDPDTKELTLNSISLGKNFPDDARAYLEDELIVIKAGEGFEMKLDVSAVKDPAYNSGSFTVKATGIGSMRLQVGSNEGQVLEMDIPMVSLQNLNLEPVDVSTAEGANDAIDRIDVAIQRLSEIRGRLGAYQNRLESTINSLDITTENMTAAYSRIMDVDMAEEMSQYTTAQVLTQAGTSMLAQANERPSQVLQLLQ
ncbi:MAG: flagellin [Acetatifactor sp.]|nr:flagellin [Acetatifactor sp.]